MIYVFVMIFVGVLIMGLISSNTVAIIIGIVGAISLSLGGIIKKYLDDKSKTNPDFIPTSKNNKDIDISDVFDDEYEYENYSLFDFSYFVKNLTGDYNHPFEKSLKKVLSIEKIDFKTFVIHFDFYYKSFSQFNFQDDVSRKYHFKEFFEFFELYLDEIKSQELSIEGFFDFLKQELCTQKLHEQNKLDEKEDIASAIVKGKRPIKYPLSDKNIVDIKNLLEIFLKNEGVDVKWLADNICVGFLRTHIDIEEKYEMYEDPSLEDVLDWFFRYSR